MFVLLALHCTFLPIITARCSDVMVDQNLTKQRTWKPQIKKELSRLQRLVVESHDVICIWPARVLTRLHDLGVSWQKIYTRLSIKK